MQLTIILAIVFALLSVLFAVQNTVPVAVVFLIWRFDSSLAVVLLLALAAGALVVALISTPATVRTRWQLGKHKRRIAELERELDAVRREVQHRHEAEVPVIAAADPDAALE